MLEGGILKTLLTLLFGWRTLPALVKTGHVVGLIGFCGYILGVCFPAFIELIYARFLYPLMAPKLAFVFSMIPWSLTDISFIVVIALLVLTPVIAAAFAMRKKRSLIGVFGSAIAWASCIFGFVFALYLSLWGLNYLRPSIVTQLKLPEISVERETELLKLMALKTNSLRLTLPSDKDGCIESNLTFEEIDREVERFQNGILKKLGFPTFSGSGSKVRMFSEFWLKRGGAGIYGPFTGERNIVMPVPPGSLTSIIAHERAHFAGFAHEDVANFWSMLTAWSIPNNEMQYSGWFRFWWLLPKSALNTYGLADEVKKDYVCLANYSDKNIGLEAKTSAELYDLWLKSQGVGNGSASYNEAAGLVLRYLDRNGVML